MSRQETQVLKGIAMLMILVLHVWAGQLDNWLVIGGRTVWSSLQTLSNPVALFCLLGGYGLYTVRERGDTHRYSRVFRLYVHFWLILLVFSAIAFFMRKPPVYPVSMGDVFLNFSSIHISWNPVCQFLLPYVLLSLSYPFLFRVLDKKGCWVVGVVTFVIYGLAGLLYGRYGDALGWEIPERYCFYLCPFMWGAILRKSDVLHKLTIGG